jgi:GxxExxY protein
MTKLLHYSLSNKILNMAFSVHNILGPGLVESAYEEGYCVELRRSGIYFERQKVYALYYKGECIGSFFARYGGRAPNSADCL